MRMAGSRNLVAGPLPPSMRHGDARFEISGTTLEAIQGPIPELAIDAEPEWLATYRAAAAKLPSLRSFLDRRQAAREDGGDGPASSSPTAILHQKSPYARRLALPPGGGGGGASGENEAARRQRQQRQQRQINVAFDAVYNVRHADGSRPNDDDYAAALESLTALGFKPEDDPEILARASQLGERKPADDDGGVRLKVLESKFPVVVGGEGEEAAAAEGAAAAAVGGGKPGKPPTTEGAGGGGGGDGPAPSPSPYVSGGHGFLHKATSTSVLRSIARLAFAREQERLRRLGLKTKKEQERLDELRRMHAKKKAKKKPPTIRTSVQFDDGSKYRGDWSTRKLGAHGHGMLDYRNGDKYVGQFKRHLFDGKGRYDYANGDSYEGEWSQGLKCGQGTFIRAVDETSIEGQWKNDMANGRCVCRYGNGAVYEGFYKNDLKEGQGKYTAANGDTYEGEFEADKIMGSGLFIDRQNRTSFRGQFNNGRRKAKTDESARFTLHHKLYGDFAARGGLQFGGNEEERRGAADLNIGGSPPPAAPKKKESEEEKRRRKIRPLDMPKEKRTSANCPLPKTSSDGSVALSEMSG